jgi:hypothetical protein
MFQLELVAFAEAAGKNKWHYGMDYRDKMGLLCWKFTDME